MFCKKGKFLYSNVFMHQNKRQAFFTFTFNKHTQEHLLNGPRPTTILIKIILVIRPSKLFITLSLLLNIVHIFVIFFPFSIQPQKKKNDHFVFVNWLFKGLGCVATDLRFTRLWLIRVDNFMQMGLWTNVSKEAEMNLTCKK